MDGAHQRLGARPRAGQCGDLAGSAGDGFFALLPAQPQTLPVAGGERAGRGGLPTLGADIDICTDVPRYRVWRQGELVDEPTDISALWREDLVTFVIGCSFSFEEALTAAGLPLRHIEQGNAMSRCTAATSPQRRPGVFMAPWWCPCGRCKAAEAIRAIQITSRFPNVHGAPVHLGDPRLIGIMRHQQARLWRCG